MDFDTGYLAYGLEYQMYKMETEGEPDFYNHSNRLYYIAGIFMEKNNDNFYLADGRVFYPSAKIGNGLASSDLYHEIESRLDYKGFRINASCTKIPKLKDKYDSSSWGNYKAVSFYQGSTSDCGVIAIMDLLHTFKLSGGKDYTKGLSPSAMREELRGLTNWQGNIAGEGMLPMDLTRGCTNYIGEAGVSLKSTGDYRDDLPEICLYYSLNVANTSHFAMKVGSAQQDYWWVFKTYWDIIVSWASNYYVDSSGMPSSLYESDSCYYLVDQQYRQGAYQLCYGDMLIGVK